ncbi:MAG: hydrogenase expression/formation protein HupK [Mangrovicoccus sp.]
MYPQAALPFTIQPAPEPPVAQLMLGRPVAEVVETLPRLFNLCRAAQSTAAHMAFGMTPPTDLVSGVNLGAEITRDHLARLGLLLPRHLGQPVADIAEGPAAVLGAGLPQDPSDFAAYLRSGTPLAALLRGLIAHFGPGEACADLPLPDDEDLQPGRAVENSPAARHADHPLMQYIALTQGKGPLWRVVARALDLTAARAGRLPLPRCRASDGAALCPAARGTYAIHGKAADGHVTALTRITPTDHLLAPNGILEQSLASLPAAKSHLAPLLLDILDPCRPVALEPKTGEPAHA